jgi:CxxC motif-containing protein (DUF1111 family)
MNPDNEARSANPRRRAHAHHAGPAGLGVLLAVLCGTTALAQDGVPGVGQIGGPIGPMTQAEYRLWRQGREVFDRDFDVTLGVGLPDFNANSCRACHSDPVMGGAGPLEVNVSRFGHDGGGLLPFSDLPGGQAASKLRPPPDGTRENIPDGNPDPASDADVFEQRQTPTLLGMGLMDGIPDEVILANEDPNDLDRDGILGVARIIMVNGQPEVGRFGWKAQVPHTADFVRDAMGAEIGITTPDDGRGFAFETDADAVPDPELSLSDIDKMAFFLQKLAPPFPSGESTPQIQSGQLLFSALRCDRCHIPTLDGADGPVPLYSDLLLHDVMGEAFRGMAEPGADVGLYRTPPLWGIKDTAPYLHDGRAETLEVAIAMHRSEALFSSIGFQSLSKDEQRHLLQFLKSL